MRVLHLPDNSTEWEALDNLDLTINGGEEVNATANIVYGTTDGFSFFAPATTPTQPPDDDDDGGSGGGGGGGGGSRSVTITWPSVTTLPESHFIDFPLDRVKVSSSSFVNAAGASVFGGQVGQQTSIASTFTNYQQTDQTYAFIVQITDADGYTTEISWQQGTVPAGATADVSTLWTP
jgi:hypothetical protein